MKKKLRTDGNRRTALNCANHINYTRTKLEELENDNDECESEEYWEDYYEED